MSRVAIDEAKLINLANNIRAKTYTTDSMDIDEMAAAVTTIGEPELEEITIKENGTYEPTAYGYSKVTVECPPAPTDEELTLTGNCQYRFGCGGWEWFIDKYKDRITTKDITDISYMFFVTSATEIPFQINIKNCNKASNFIGSARQLTVCPKIRGTITWSGSTDFSNATQYCEKIRDFEDLFTPDMLDGISSIKVTSSYSTPKLPSFYYAHSLRKVPSWVSKYILNPESTAFPYYGYTPYYNLFTRCYSLDEALNIPVWSCVGAQTSNMFSSIIDGCYRLNDFTFETNEDGTPIVANWKSQYIAFTYGVGFVQSGYIARTTILGYNSGITADKEVDTVDKYQALKDDPDWFTQIMGYSRYNHDSAVRTINSLPDTSAYLATAGGTNTIKFTGDAGSKTDGGAINTLTPEEIAVAANKGWTVTFE